MRSRFAVLLALVAALPFAVPATASAATATEAGNGCAGTKLEDEGITLVGLSNGSASPLSATVPSAGVITGWTTNLAPFATLPPVPLEARLQIYRPLGSQSADLVGEAEPIVLKTSATSSVKTTGRSRIPVLPGDLIADTGSANLSGKEIELDYYCPGQPATVSAGLVEGVGSVGEEARIAGNKSGLAVAATVQIEPDADGDGFGDITQDAATHDPFVHAACHTGRASAATPPCPRPSQSPLSARAAVGRGALRVIVASDAAASVSATGRVRVGPRAITLVGPRKRARAGGTATLVLPFSRELRRSLAEVPPSRSLKLRVLVTAAGVEPARPITVEIHGRGPRR